MLNKHKLKWILLGINLFLVNKNFSMENLSPWEQRKINLSEKERELANTESDLQCREIIVQQIGEQLEDRENNLRERENILREREIEFRKQYENFQNNTHIKKISEYDQDDLQIENIKQFNEVITLEFINNLRENIEQSNEVIKLEIINKNTFEIPKIEMDLYKSNDNIMQEKKEKEFLENQIKDIRSSLYNQIEINKAQHRDLQKKLKAKETDCEKTNRTVFNNYKILKNNQKILLEANENLFQQAQSLKENIKILKIQLKDKEKISPKKDEISRNLQQNFSEKEEQLAEKASLEQENILLMRQVKELESEHKKIFEENTYLTEYREKQDQMYCKIFSYNEILNQIIAQQLEQVNLEKKINKDLKEEKTQIEIRFQNLKLLQKNETDQKKHPEYLYNAYGEDSITKRIAMQKKELLEKKKKIEEIEENLNEARETLEKTRNELKEITETLEAKEEKLKKQKEEIENLSRYNVELKMARSEFGNKQSFFSKEELEDQAKNLFEWDKLLTWREQSIVPVYQILKLDIIERTEKILIQEKISEQIKEELVEKQKILLSKEQELIEKEKFFFLLSQDKIENSTERIHEDSTRSKEIEKVVEKNQEKLKDSDKFIESESLDQSVEQQKESIQKNEIFNDEKENFIDELLKVQIAQKKIIEHLTKKERIQEEQPFDKLFLDLNSCLTKQNQILIEERGSVIGIHEVYALDKQNTSHMNNKLMQEILSLIQEKEKLLKQNASLTQQLESKEFIRKTEELDEKEEELIQTEVKSLEKQAQLIQQKDKEIILVKKINIELKNKISDIIAENTRINFHQYTETSIFQMAYRKNLLLQKNMMAQNKVTNDLSKLVVLLKKALQSQNKINGQTTNSINKTRESLQKKEEELLISKTKLTETIENFKNFFYIFNSRPEELNNKEKELLTKMMQESEPSVQQIKRIPNNQPINTIQNQREIDIQLKSIGAELNTKFPGLASKKIPSKENLNLTDHVSKNISEEDFTEKQGISQENNQDLNQSKENLEIVKKSSNKKNKKKK
jgi:hypothetical protein